MTVRRPPQHLCASTARQVEMIMKEIYTRIGLDHHTYVTTINQQGVKVVTDPHAVKMI